MCVVPFGPHVVCGNKVQVDEPVAELLDKKGPILRETEPINHDEVVA